MSTIKTLDSGFVVCRVRRHVWDNVQDDGGGGGRRTFKASRTIARLMQRCERCGTVRYEAWNKTTGAILFVQYKHPRDYHLESGFEGERIPLSDVRKEYLKRHLQV